MELTVSFIKLFFWIIYLASPLLMLFCALIVLLGMVACYLEKWSKFDALYWSFITAATVGYGDFRPLKRVSKVLSIIIALLGIMFTGIIVAITLYTLSIALQNNLDSDVKSELRKEIGIEQKGSDCIEMDVLNR